MFRSLVLSRPRPSVARPSRLARLLAMAALRAERRQLGRLDDHLLADIGLSAEAAQRESRRPAWDVPPHWRSSSR